MTSSTLRKFALGFDSMLPFLLALGIAVGLFTSGCSDGGTDYEVVAPPANSGSGGSAGNGGSGSGTLTPPSSGNGGNPSSCQHIPYKWELISYNGCETSPRMVGLIRDELDGTDFDSFFHGKSFATSSGGPVAGQTFVLDQPGANECGPALLSMVSNSGTIDVKVYRNSAGDPEEVEFYLLNPDLMDEVWLETHDGSAPTEDDYYGLAFNELMLDVFDCYKNVDCPLLKDLNSKGKSLPPNIVTVQPVTSEASANGSFCGKMLLVAKSRG